MSVLRGFLFLFLSVFVFRVHSVLVSPIDIPALEALYNATNGPTTWTVSWNSNFSLLCQTSSTVACFSNGRVRSLSLASSGLSGTLPTEIGLLTWIDSLLLNGNSIGGTIPTEIGLLNNTSTLTLDYNEFTGPIPSQLALLTLLPQIILESNYLSGTIPTELALHPTATSMWFMDNELEGSIPEEWGPNVVNIYLNNNNLNGTIPTTIFSYPNLQILRLQYNNLNGTIPTEIGNSNLIQFYINFNNIYGTIPTEISTALSMQRLWLYVNNLEGTIPTQIGNLVNLIDFKAWHNDLTGSIPSQFGLLHSLQDIQIHTNDLSGTVPTELGNCASLNSVLLQDNALQGHVAGPLIRLSALKTLDLTDNCFAPLEPYSSIYSNDYSSYTTASSCPFQGPYPSNALLQAPAVCYEFYLGSLLDDSSTSVNDLQLTSYANYTTLQVGQYENPWNGGIQLYSSSNYAMVTSSLVTLAGSFTIELLVICQSLSQTNILFALSTVNTLASELFKLQVTTTGAVTLIYEGSSFVESAAGKILVNHVHHILLTWDDSGKIIYLYIDGVLQASASGGSAPVSGSYYLYFGMTANLIFDEIDVYQALYQASLVQARVALLDWCPAGSCASSQTCYPSITGSTCA